MNCPLSAVSSPLLKKNLGECKLRIMSRIHCTFRNWRLSVMDFLDYVELMTYRIIPISKRHFGRGVHKNNRVLESGIYPL